MRLIARNPSLIVIHSSYRDTREIYRVDQETPFRWMQRRVHTEVQSAAVAIGIAKVEPCLLPDEPE